MLRKTYSKNHFKKIVVPPLMESENSVVDVEVFDPISHKSIGKRQDSITQEKVLDEKSFVSSESADLFSIENMTKVGIQPTVATGYINNSLDDLPEMESFAQNTLDSIPGPETPTE